MTVMTEQIIKDAVKAVLSASHRGDDQLPKELGELIALLIIDHNRIADGMEKLVKCFELAEGK